MTPQRKYTAQKTEMVRGSRKVIRQLMEDQGVSTGELADRLNVSASYVSQTINGSGQGSLATFETFANVMGHTLLAPEPLPLHTKSEASGRLKPKEVK